MDGNLFKREEEESIINKNRDPTTRYESHLAWSSTVTTVFYGGEREGSSGCKVGKQQPTIFMVWNVRLLAKVVRS